MNRAHGVQISIMHLTSKNCSKVMCAWIQRKYSSSALSVYFSSDTAVICLNKNGYREFYSYREFCSLNLIIQSVQKETQTFK